MKHREKEPLWEQLADKYVEEDGRRLLQEAEELERQATEPLPRMDRKARAYQASRRRGRTMAAFGAVAAGLLLIFILPRLTPLSPQESVSAPQSEIAATQQPPAEITAQDAVIAPEAAAPEMAAEAESAQMESAVAEPAEASPKTAPSLPAIAGGRQKATAPAAESAPQGGDAASDALPDMEDSAPDAFRAMDAAPGGGGTEVIPLSFALPEGFTISAVHTDQGETIYHLANAARDDVVLTLSRDGEAPEPAGLYRVESEGGTAWGASGGGCQYLAFERDGLWYRLTCRYDIHTLLSLWRHIVTA